MEPSQPWLQPWNKSRRQTQTLIMFGCVCESNCCCRYFYCFCFHNISCSGGVAVTSCRCKSTMGLASAPLVDGIVNHVLLQSIRPRPQPVALSTRSRPSHFSGKPDLASLPKSCNLLGWDMDYSEATDQVRWMQVSPVAAAWLSRMLCAPVNCLVVTRRTRQTPVTWQVTTVDSETPHGSSNC